jgi:hypothetical protein
MRTPMLGALSAMVIMIAGCGGTDSYDNAERPPAPLNVSVSLTRDRIAISPPRIGAGPVVLLVSNQTGKSRDLTLTPPDGGSSSCVKRDVSSGPINPEGNARVQVSLVEGDCEIGVQDGALPPTQLTVGPNRPTAQQTLLQP